MAALIPAELLDHFSLFPRIWELFPKGYPIERSLSSCRVLEVIGSQRPQYFRLVMLGKKKHGSEAFFQDFSGNCGGFFQFFISPQHRIPASNKAQRAQGTKMGIKSLGKFSFRYPRILWDFRPLEFCGIGSTWNSQNSPCSGTAGLVPKAPKAAEKWIKWIKNG